MAGDTGIPGLFITDFRRRGLKDIAPRSDRELMLPL